MQLRIFTPGDLVCRKGEVAREMYVIIDGKIEVIGAQGQVLKVLSGGDFFGEIGILSLSEGQNRRTADVRTVGYVECFVLSKEDVLSAIRDYPEAQAVLAEYGKKRLERQNSAQDPRLVDVDETNGTDKPVSDDNTDRLVTQKLRNSLQTFKPKNELSLNSTANFLSNGHYKLERPSLRPSSGRAILLEPIQSKLRRGRRLSGDTALQSLQTEGGKGESEDCIKSDELLSQMFSNSCMEALNYLKKAFEEKLAKEMKDVNGKLREFEELRKQRDETISHLKSLLTNTEKELEDCKHQIKELESESFIKEQTIQQLRGHSEAGNQLSSRSRTISSTVSSSSLLASEVTHC